jgi:glycosyltransferase involved in cell wall biosynthesis
MDLSIIIPVLNEQRNVVMLHKRILEVLSPLKYKYEIIFVDDGSTDNTDRDLEFVSKKDKKVKVITFMRNFGKSSALSAGFDQAKGKLILTMDGDLQDDPSEIPRFLDKAAQGYDLVAGWKYRRRDSFTKIMLSKLFNHILRKSTGIKLHDNDNNFRIIKKEIIPHLNLYAGMYRYIPIFAFKKGYRVGELKVKHNPRRFGKSKYGLERIYKGFFDLITLFYLLRFMVVPLYLFGGMGGVSLSLGFIFGLYLTYIKLFMGALIGGRPLLTLSVLLIILGVQFIFFGLLAEMFTNIHQKGKKDYVIRSVK